MFQQKTVVVNNNTQSVFTSRENDRNEMRKTSSSQTKNQPSGSQGIWNEGL